MLIGMHSNLILETNFTSMDMVPVSDTQALLSANATIVIDQILGNSSLLHVNRVLMNVAMIYVLEDDTEVEDNPSISLKRGPQELLIGYLNTSKEIIPTSQVGSVVNISIDKEYITIDNETNANFVKFITDFIRKGTCTDLHPLTMHHDSTDNCFAYDEQ